MTKIFQELNDGIQAQIADLHLSAEYGSDRGPANKLERDFKYFYLGLVANGSLSEEDDIEVPEEWEKYFVKEDPEYIEYLRLKSKFKGK